MVWRVLRQVVSAALAIAQAADRAIGAVKPYLRKRPKPRGITPRQ